MSGANNVKMLV